MNEREQAITMLEKIGINNPADDDIPFIPLYMAGFTKEEILRTKQGCDKHKIPYEKVINTLLR